MRLLIAEDEPELADQLKDAMTQVGYAVDVAADGEDALHLGNTEPYDAVILDLGLPLMDGIAVLERWRKAGRTMPVLVLTARDRWSDKVAGMDAGADDYLAKPFHMAELQARLRALIRRATGHASAELVCGPVRLDTRAATVTVDSQPVRLTGHEFRVLAYLMHHRGRVISRTELTEHIYDQDFDRDSNVVEVLVGRIRRKLDPDGLRRPIETLRGRGYRLVSEPR
jgi:two-component system, OmpR family, response regulator